MTRKKKQPNELKKLRKRLRQNISEEEEKSIHYYIDNYLRMKKLTNVYILD
jgi:hypothetical protein